MNDALKNFTCLNISNSEVLTHVKYILIHLRRVVKSRGMFTAV